MAGLALAVDILAKDRASGTLKKIGDESQRTHSKLATIGAGLAGGAIGAGVVEFGKKAVEAAVEGEQAQARLAQAVKNTGGSMDELEPKVAALSDRFAKFGYTNDQVRSALAQMTTSLGDPAKALGAMGLAADLAKFKNVDLTTASIAVAKAMQGQLRPLKQLGIDLPVAAGGAKAVAAAHAQLTTATQKLSTFLKIHADAVKTDSKQHGVYLQMLDKVKQAQAKVNASQGAATSITKALAKAVGGQASASAGTYAGKMAALHAQFQNLSEQVGEKLLPILIKLLSKLETMANFIERNRKVIEPLAKIFGTLVATFWLAQKAAKAFEAVMVVLNVEMDANPVGIIVLGLAALVIGFTEAWKHSETFRKVVKWTFSSLLGPIKAFLEAVGATFRVLGHLPGFGWAKRAAADVQGAVDKLDALQKKLAAIPDKKNITITLTEQAAVSAAIAAEDAGRGASQRQHRGITHVTTNVHLDGKQIASVVTKHQTAATQNGRLAPGIS